MLCITGAFLAAGRYADSSFLPFLLSKLALYYILCITGALLAGEKSRQFRAEDLMPKTESRPLERKLYLFKDKYLISGTDKAIKRTGYFRACPEKLLRYEV